MSQIKHYTTTLGNDNQPQFINNLEDGAVVYARNTTTGASRLYIKEQVGGETPVLTNIGESLDKIDVGSMDTTGVYYGTDYGFYNIRPKTGIETKQINSTDIVNTIDITTSAYDDFDDGDYTSSTGIFLDSTQYEDTGSASILIKAGICGHPYGGQITKNESSINVANDFVTINGSTVINGNTNLNGNVNTNGDISLSDNVVFKRGSSGNGTLTIGKKPTSGGILGNLSGVTINSDLYIPSGMSVTTNTINSIEYDSDELELSALNVRATDNLEVGTNLSIGGIISSNVVVGSAQSHKNLSVYGSIVSSDTITSDGGSGFSTSKGYHIWKNGNTHTFSVNEDGRVNATFAELSYTSGTQTSSIWINPRYAGSTLTTSVVGNERVTDVLPVGVGAGMYVVSIGSGILRSSIVYVDGNQRMYSCPSGAADASQNFVIWIEQDALYQSYIKIQYNYQTTNNATITPLGYSFL